MKTLDEMKRELEKVFLPVGAFVRVDKGNGLFVTDAPRRAGEIPALPEGFSAITENGIMHITPDFEDVPEGLKVFALEFLKGDAGVKERLLRQNLAVMMRLKDAEGAEFLRNLAKSMQIHL